MITANKVSAVAAAALMLGGCQSFPLTSWMFKGERSETRHLAGNTAGALEEGRAFLRDGNIAAAVASFRIASLDRANQADACNGLGVAYAMLGREDLAQRYFREAMTIEPTNPRYAANILRLQRQVMLASQSHDKAQTSEVYAAVPQPAARLASLERQPSAQVMTRGPVERVSRGEVRVRVRPALGSAPITTVVFADRRSSGIKRNSDATSEAGAAGPSSTLFQIQE